MAPSYILSKEAEKDWINIAKYTLENYGERQLQTYTNSLLKCIDDLSNQVGQYKKLDISGHQVLNIRCNKHYIFALRQEDKSLIVLAILHERIELIQRLKVRLK